MPADRVEHEAGIRADQLPVEELARLSALVGQMVLQDHVTRRKRLLRGRILEVLHRIVLAQNNPWAAQRNPKYP